MSNLFPNVKNDLKFKTKNKKEIKNEKRKPKERKHIEKENPGYRTFLKLVGKRHVKNPNIGRPICDRSGGGGARLLTMLRPT